MKYRYILTFNKNTKFGSTMEMTSIISYKPIVVSEIDKIFEYFEKKNSENSNIYASYDLVSISMIEKSEEVRTDECYGDYILEEILEDGE